MGEGSPSPYGDSCFSDEGTVWTQSKNDPQSPSPYGDSCFSDSWDNVLLYRLVLGLRPLTGIRVSLTPGIMCSYIAWFLVSVPLRGFVFL